jgi:glyoxylase-like metal-dependent hydrolase (beta-lactamase superfamily II)
VTSVAAQTATGSDQYEAWQQRRIPSVEQVRHGVWSIPVPIPDSPLRYVLVYAVEIDGGIALIDSGWPSTASWDGLLSGLADAGHPVEDVRAVLVTHAHADHHGLSSELSRVSGAWIGMHAADAAQIGETEPLPVRRRKQAEWLGKRGVPVGEAAVLQSATEPFLLLLDQLSVPDVLIRDDDRPLPGREDIRAIWTPGHSPGHLCFLAERDRLLFAGDHLLPRITPHVSRGPDADDDAVGDYLSSLRLVAHLDVDEVLPAHEYRFAGLAGRVTEMLEHHAHRLDEIEQTVARLPRATTWSVAADISWTRGWDNAMGVMRQTAISETYSHLLHLEKTGRVTRQDSSVDLWQSRDR